MEANFGNAAHDYRKHRAGFPDSFFQALEEKGLIIGSERVADIGTGTGSVARGLASMGCTVTGIDPSIKLLDQARELAVEQSLTIDWKEGTAEKLPLEDQSMDKVTAGQCWHWFNASEAIAEIKRVLKPSGRLIIAHFDWLAYGDNVVSFTELMIKNTNPQWDMDGGIGIYPEWFRHLSEGGFNDIQSFPYDETVLYSQESWRGRIRASAGVSGSQSPEKVNAFDEAHKKMLLENCPEDPLSIPHRIFVIHGQIAEN